jgi:uncharacterized membrane protein
VRSGEEGSVVIWLGMPAVAVLGVMLVLVVDLGAYLVASERAQAAADAVALAAAPPCAAGAPHPAHSQTAARAVAEANQAELRALTCVAGDAEATVAVTVRAVAVTRFAGRTVTATARARMVRSPPERTDHRAYAVV